MDKSDRKPGTWEKSPSERLAASKRARMRSGASQNPTHTQRQNASETPKGTQRKPRAPHTPRTTHKTTATHTPRHTPRASQRPSQNTHNLTREPANGARIHVGGIEISVRLIFLLIMLGLFAALIAPSIAQWIRQEQELRAIQREVEDARSTQSANLQQLELWNNPDFIAAQARERLGYVMPGETQYSVVDPGPGHQDLAQVAAGAPKGPARPWMYNFLVLTALADSRDNIPATQNVLRSPAPEAPQSTTQTDGEQSAEPAPTDTDATEEPTPAQDTPTEPNTIDTETPNEEDTATE